MGFIAYIGVGSNLGNRWLNICRALGHLENNSHTKILKVSSFYENPAQSPTPQPYYLNGVIKIETDLPATQLLAFLQDIEYKLGRRRDYSCQPRPIDLDILLYGDLNIQSPQLTIPHPRMWQRDFVIRPLGEIEPDILKTRHPQVISGK